MVEGRNAVLPQSASWPREQIGRAWLNDERRALPTCARLPAEAQRTRRKQRHADDLIELRLVSMPADPCARPIFVDEDLPEGVLRAVEQHSDLASQGEKKSRKWRRLHNRATVIVIAGAEAHDLAIRKIAMVVE